MKKWISILLAAGLCLVLAGCGRWGILSNELDGLLFGTGSYDYDYDTDTGAQSQSGDGEIIYGERGDTLSTCFFDYSVEDAVLTSHYEGYAAAEGMLLLDVTLTVTNTYGSELPMSVYDFQVQWGSGADDFGYEVPSLWASRTTMEQAYTLADGESITTHVVYEVPEKRTEFSIAYQERFADNTTGDSFFLYFTMQEDDDAPSGATAA